MDSNAHSNGSRRGSRTSRVALVGAGVVAAAGWLVVPATAQPAGAGVAQAGRVAAAPAGADVARRAARKGLTVKVKRPDEARQLVKVTVRGPRGFRKTIKRTKTWSSARPGVYRIKARTIELFDQEIKPRVVRKRVRIKQNRARRTSRVTYAAPVFCDTSGSEVLAWGEGDHGRLGDDPAVDRLTPTAVPRLLGATAATGGERTSYALCQDGTVWAWGFNQYGELGNGTTGDRSWPVKVEGLTSITAIAAREQGALALRSDGTVWSWGWGQYGQLGNGAPYSTSTVARTPVQVALPGPASAIAAGGNTAYALVGGTVMAWGNGGVGQLGHGASNVDSAAPVAVQGLSGITQIAAGHAHAYALRADDTVWAWGSGGQGELGNGASANQNTPVAVSLPAGAPVASVASSFAAGYVVLDNGSVWSWGSGRYGDVGFDNAGNPVTTPRSNVTLAGVSRIVGAGYGAYALTTAGTVWAWGDNGSGQLGTGAAPTGPSHVTGGVPTPTQIPWLAGVTSIGAGALNGYAVR